ncbi:MAG TPA: hypothetical protein VJR58_10170 [Vineibacter sp.]|nr:hypothetical protein [Vineibacter sp.]
MTIQQQIDTLRAQHMKTETQQTVPGSDDFHQWRMACLDALSARTVQAFGKRMGNAAWEGLRARPPGG